MEAQTEKPKNFFENLKDRIALYIVMFSFLIVALLVISSLIGNFNNNKDLIGLILPVVGTWMGTVLAFYFTKENFEAASKSMQQTITKLSGEEKLKSMKTKDVMINIEKIKHPFSGDKTIDTVTLKDLIKFMDQKDVNRIVVIENKKVKYVLHKSLIDSFIRDQIFNNNRSADELSEYTLPMMYENGSQEIKDKMDKGVEFINQDATLYDVQKKMNENQNCQDVFITSGGNKDEDAIGWITNVIISENVKA